MKKTYSTNAAEELTAWLVLAAFGLVPHARERIKREIEAHFVDAVAAHIADGLSQDAAEARALKELGDIHSAAKAFQKKHLTEEEEKWLQGLLTENSSQRRSRRMRFFIALFISTLLTIWLIRWSHPQDIRMTYIPLVPLWSFFLLSAAPTLRLSYLTMHGLAGPALWRKFLALDMINDVFNVSNSMFGSLLLLSQLSNRSHLAGGCLLFVIVFLFPLSLFFFDKRFRVWRKLGHSLANPDTAMEA